MDAHVLGVQQFTVHLLKLHALPVHCLAKVCKILGDAAHLVGVVGIALRTLRNELGKVLADRSLIEAAGKIDVLGSILWSKPVQTLLAPPHIVLVRILGHIAADVVAIRHLRREHNGTIIPAPHEV